MPGTKTGGAKASNTNRQKYGEDFYERIGSLGGKKGRTGGFACDVPCRCDVLRGKHYIKNCAGVKGGLKSRLPKGDING